MKSTVVPNDLPRVEEGAPKGERRPYQAPRIEKKRAVSRATLFTGSGPSSGGVVSQG